MGLLYLSFCPGSQMLITSALLLFKTFLLLICGLCCLKSVLRTKSRRRISAETPYPSLMPAFFDTCASRACLFLKVLVKEMLVLLRDMNETVFPNYLLEYIQHFRILLNPAFNISESQYLKYHAMFVHSVSFEHQSCI